MIFLRYSTVFLGFAIGVALLVSWFNTNMNSALGSSAQLMVPAMIAALIEGQQFARANKRMAKQRVAWEFAVYTTGLALSLNIILAYLGPVLLPEFGKLAIAPLLSKQFLILLGLYAVGYLLCNRYFFGLGTSNQLSLMRSRGEIE